MSPQKTVYHGATDSSIEIESEFDNINILSHYLDGDWIPECESENKPFIGQTFPDMNTAFQFYHNYGSR